jgi:hypothetical protein
MNKNIIKEQTYNIMKYENHWRRDTWLSKPCKFLNLYKVWSAHAYIYKAQKFLKSSTSIHFLFNKEPKFYEL